MEFGILREKSLQWLGNVILLGIPWPRRGLVRSLLGRLWRWFLVGSLSRLRRWCLVGSLGRLWRRLVRSLFDMRLLRRLVG